MANFIDFVDIKEQVKKLFLSDQELVNLLCFRGANLADTENYKLGISSPAKKLIKTYKYVPETIEDDNIYITMASHVEYTNDAAIKSVTVDFFIFCHKSRVETLQGNRHDLIADRIDRILNGSLDFPDVGIGKVQLTDADEFIPMDDYYGWSMTYRLLAFNREGYAI
jgi:hypothetical protein|nr:MAG TPA: hypothetical protein [Caudoviricetes sp.]